MNQEEKKDSQKKKTPANERDPLTEKIIGCCFKAHTDLGPGFREKIYHNALKLLLEKEGFEYQSERKFEVFYLDKQIGLFRVDFMVEEKVIVEIKSVKGFMPKLFESQLISYLKASNTHVGLLVNFGSTKCQVKRFVF
ncbi:GxxExxY protein [bacterium]|nr:GxxExxY protein [bacterium]